MPFSVGSDNWCRVFNLENDIVGKYIQKFVDIGRNSGADRGKMPDDENAAGNAKGNSGLSMEFLQKYGF